MVYFENIKIIPLQQIQAKCPGCGRCLVCGEPEAKPARVYPYWQLDPFSYPSTVNEILTVDNTTKT